MSNHSPCAPEERGPHRTCPAGEVERELVPPAGIEPATSTLGKSRSIRLSYGGLGGGFYWPQGAPSKPDRRLLREACSVWPRHPSGATSAELASSRRDILTKRPVRSASLRPSWRHT